MILKSCIMYDSTCYKQNKTGAKHVGIVVHSTGANNPTLKRYVQPSEDDLGYKAILQDIGVNKYKNSWNQTDRQAGVHAFIGKNDFGVIEVYQVLPYDFYAWGVGKGPKGSYNFAPTSHIQFEMCEDKLDNEEYFNDVMKSAQEYCAQLCYMFTFNPYTDICSHHECALRGYGADHSDPHKWLSNFGKDMDWFRERVADILYHKYPYAVYNINDELLGYYETEEKAKSKIGCRVVYLLASEPVSVKIEETFSAKEEVAEEILPEDTFSKPLQELDDAVNVLEDPAEETETAPAETVEEEPEQSAFLQLILAIIRFFANLFSKENSKDE